MRMERRQILKVLCAQGAAALLGQTPQPRRILLAHGVFGFAKIGSLAYFNGVRPCFDADCTFLEPGVDPVGSIESRARELEKAILATYSNEELARGGAIHIVANSMAGLDARYLISSKGLGRASWFASLTTISTPHRGTPLVDIVTGVRSPRLNDVAATVERATDETIISVLRSLRHPIPPSRRLRALGPAAIHEALSDFKSYTREIFGRSPAAFGELRPAFMQSFNQEYPNLEGVPLLCYSGVSSPDQTMCRALFPSWIALKSMAGDNDGMVPTSASG